MKIFDCLSVIKARELSSNVKGNNGKAKLLNLSSKIPGNINGLSRGAYIVDIDKASESDAALKIDSLEQADQVIAEIKENIEQNPTEAASAHGYLNSGMTTLSFFLKHFE